MAGRQILVGGHHFVEGRLRRKAKDHPAAGAGSMLVTLAVDGKIAGHLVMADPLREGTREFLSGLRQLGMDRILLATGDTRAVGLYGGCILGPV